MTKLPLKSNLEEEKFTLDSWFQKFSPQSAGSIPLEHHGQRAEESYSADGDKDTDGWGEPQER